MMYILNPGENRLQQKKNEKTQYFITGRLSCDTKDNLKIHYRTHCLV